MAICSVLDVAHPVVGRWRIVEMDNWDLDAIELLGPGTVEMNADGTGQFRFIAVEGWIDWKPADGPAAARADFSWEGNDECDQASGRGWVERTDGGDLRGHLYFHMGDDSAFRAVASGKDPTSL
jgi:hypothetical protein